MAAVAYCLVGSNTGSPNLDTLHVLECDTETGAAKIVQTVRGYQGTTYFQIAADRKSFYSVLGEKRDCQQRGAVVKFALNGHRIGAMTKLAELPCETPCHVALSRDERLISTASYMGRTACLMNVDGSGLKSLVLPNDHVGPRDDRQKQAYAHCSFYTPEGWLGVNDLGCDRINFYTIPDLQPVFSLAADAGDGPRHSLFSKDGKFLFVVNELSSTVASYRWLGRDTRRISKIAMTPPGTDPRSTKAAAIKLTADGKILMASNRGYNSIAFYAVGEDGSLAYRNCAKLAKPWARDFELMPGEQFMVVGLKMSNEIQIYRFNRDTCELTAVGEPIACWRPLCFKFL